MVRIAVTKPVEVPVIEIPAHTRVKAWAQASAGPSAAHRNHLRSARRPEGLLLRAQPEGDRRRGFRKTRLRPDRHAGGAPYPPQVLLPVLRRPGESVGGAYRAHDAENHPQGHGHAQPASAGELPKVRRRHAVLPDQAVCPSGVDIPRHSKSGWAMAVAKPLEPLGKLFQTVIRSGPVVDMDETTLQILKEPGRPNTSTSYLWLFRGGNPDRPTVVYRYEPTRSGSDPRTLWVS